jgi:tRNA G10  N-methylase Trm11
MPKYLCFFMHRLLEFRVPELIAVAEMHGLTAESLRMEWCTPFREKGTFMWIELPSVEVAVSVANRAVLLRGIYQVFASGKSYEELHQSLAATADAETEAHFSAEDPFKFEVHAIGRRFHGSEKLELMDKFVHDAPARFRPKGKVNLKAPSRTFAIIEEHDFQDREDNSTISTVPDLIYFGLQLSEGNHSIMDRYDLKKRKYIGTTSMSAELSFLVANMAKAQRSKLIVDPFVGTGSLLVACSHFGASLIGADIDVRVLKGKGDKDILANYGQYGSQRSAARRDTTRCNALKHDTTRRVAVQRGAARHTALQRGAARHTARCATQHRASRRHATRLRQVRARAAARPRPMRQRADRARPAAHTPPATYLPGCARSLARMAGPFGFVCAHRQRPDRNAWRGGSGAGVAVHRVRRRDRVRPAVRHTRGRAQDGLVQAAEARDRQPRGPRPRHDAVRHLGGDPGWRLFGYTRPTCDTYPYSLSKALT